MLIDSHCHLDFDKFDEDRDGVIARAAENGIDTMVTISTRVRRFGGILRIAEAYRDVFCSVGTHPHNAAEELDISASRLVELSSHDKVVAIGEAGLDYFYEHSPRESQAEGFRNHIAAARDTGLPLVIHSRDADEDMAQILREETGKGAFPFLLHCFSSGAALAQTGFELGGYISFSGILTFKNSVELRDIARALPRDRILVETDAPYLAPAPHRGKRNEPAFVRHTAQVLADTLGIRLEDVGAITSDNFYRLFTKVPRPEQRRD